MHIRSLVCECSSVHVNHVRKRRAGLKVRPGGSQQEELHPCHTTPNIRYIEAGKLTNEDFQPLVEAENIAALSRIPIISSKNPPANGDRASHGFISPRPELFRHVQYVELVLCSSHKLHLAIVQRSPVASPMRTMGCKDLTVVNHGLPRCKSVHGAVETGDAGVYRAAVYTVVAPRTQRASLYWLTCLSVCLSVCLFVCVFAAAHIHRRSRHELSRGRSAGL